MKPLAVILVNPAAGSYRPSLPAAAAAFLRRRGYLCRGFLSHRAGEIARLARQAAAARPAIIVVIGGDGTFNEAVNGLAPTTIPLAYLPAGTANVLAEELDLPQGMFAILSRALAGPARKISLGEILLADGRRRYFTLMAGVGFDGRVVHDVTPGLKRQLGKGAYLASALKNLVVYHPGEICLRTRSREITGYGAVIAKAACYGGRARVAPAASLERPRLEILVLQRPDRATLLRAAWQVIREPGKTSPGTCRFSARELALEGQAHIQLDGDYLGQLPATIGVLPDALRILG